MKKILLIVFVIIAPVIVMAQPKSLQNFYNKYAGQEGFTTVTITDKAFNLFASAQDSKEFNEMIKDIKGLNVLVYEGKPGDATAKRLHSEAMAAMPKNYYSELVNVVSGSDNVKIMVRETSTQGVVNELLIIVLSENEFVYLTIDGAIDLNKITNMSKSMNIKGLENLDKIKGGK